MRSRFVRCALVAGLLAVTPIAGISQQRESNNSSAATVTTDQRAPRHFYKLNFVLKESDGVKVLNERSFTLGIVVSTVRGYTERSTLRAGTRIPVQREKGPDYVDMGVNLDVMPAVEGEDGLEMTVNAEMSSLPTEDTASGTAPAIRQVRASSAVRAPVGKPTIVFTADDPASKHKFELEVTPMRSR